MSGPALVSASFDPVSRSVTLGFDQPIMVDEFDGSRLSVYDGSVTLRHYTGDGYELMSATAIVITLAEQGPYATPGVRLTALQGTSIFSADGDEAWLGVTELPLPFP
ncbi:MAG: hypothetical protein QM770_11290 [Tepidisphaeraceae bacterium]